MHNETTYLRRYNRHLILPEFGEQAQLDLRHAKVLVVGAGGLGCASLPYLAAAGIGEIGIIDPDIVELSNLQRQILFEEGDQHRPKVDAAKDAIEERNSECTVSAHHCTLDDTNAKELIEQYNIVLDGCDHFATRFLVNRICYETRTPLVSAAVIGWQGQLSSFTYAKGTPCYQCFVPEPPADADTCTETGVIGPLCGVIGSMQALEAIKLITETGDTLVGRVARYDALTHRWRESKLTTDPACACCSGS